MLFAFKRSKIAAGLILLLTVAVIILLWIRDQGRPVYIPAVATLLAAGVGVMAAQLMGNVLATMENTRDLGYLHVELDPEKFLDAYEEVPRRLRSGSRAEAVARSYLADGYWAKGDFDRALEALSPMPSPEDSALYGLFAAKRCACLQAKGDTAEAEEALNQLAAAEAGVHGRKPELEKNLRKQMILYRQQQNALKDQPVDRIALQKLFREAQYNLRRLEIARIFQICENRGGPAVPGEMRDYLEKQSGKTFFRFPPEGTYV